MDSSIRTSVTLLQRLQQAETDERAWFEFVDRYGPQMHRWCRRWIRQECDAEEIVQNVMVTLARKFRQFQYDPNRGKFRYWLKTLVHHAWHDFSIGRNPGDQGSGDSVLLNLLQRMEARDDLVERLQSEYDLELLEIARNQVMQEVEPHVWESYRLCAEEGLSGQDVAARLNIRIGAVYVHRSNVQKRLAEIIQRLDQT